MFGNGNEAKRAVGHLADAAIAIVLTIQCHECSRTCSSGSIDFLGKPDLDQ